MNRQDSTESSADYLSHYLEPLRPLLADADTTDIYINRPGEIWREQLGGQIACLKMPTLDNDYLQRLARQVAVYAHQGLSRAHPLLSASLPDGARIQIVMPPATQQHIAMASRRHRATVMPLTSYTLEPDQRRSVSPAPAEALPIYLAEAVRQKRNIVISGGTSSGKTTLLNSLLAEIPLSERLITIEDAAELQPGHANRVQLIAARGGRGEANVTPNDLLEAALRMRPDRILLGELRGAEAYTFLRAINTGHPGSITTIHADSTEGALRQLAIMILQGAHNLDYANALALVRSMIDIVVQIDRVNGRRCVSDVLSLGV
ncbi:MAG: P-type DNA transfer ATPase VirB11 [Asticcacaulis sp.]|uniref:P-type DNA transfer ATPase VirB11 n=1 Tax=Asticcacaulis sp. TaxID=1872648 RepID=UPI003F7C1B27